MTEAECLARMVAPGQVRPSKPYRGGVIQILVTSSCDKSCFACTQASNLRRKPWFMAPDQFETACLSLKGYFGVVGVFGGNPALSPHFEAYCDILARHFPREQRGLWCNSPMGKGAVMRRTFDPSVSNINVHLDRAAYDEFKRDWPECSPVGLTQDSRHSPVHLAMKDVLRITCNDCSGAGGTFTAPNGDVYLSDPGGLEDTYRKCETCDGTGKAYDERRGLELISRCPINQHWSALVGVFRGEVRAWFCEVAAAQAILHQDEPDYPDTGVDPNGDYNWYCNITKKAFRGVRWWQLPMSAFAPQVRKHCHECAVPLQGFGALAQGPEDQKEQTSATHAAVYRPKRPRTVEVVTDLQQLGTGRITRMTNYLQNAAL